MTAVTSITVSPYFARMAALACSAKEDTSRVRVLPPTSVLHCFLTMAMLLVKAFYSSRNKKSLLRIWFGCLFRRVFLAP